MNEILVSPLQLKLKDFCVWIENKFEERISRADFAIRIFIVAAGMWAARQLPGLPTWILAAWLAFWGVLQIVRRLHDLRRSGTLFWAILVPFAVALRVSEVFHLAQNPQRGWVWVLLAVLCGWSIWLSLQLLFKPGSPTSRNRA